MAALGTLGFFRVAEVREGFAGMKEDLAADVEGCRAQAAMD